MIKKPLQVFNFSIQNKGNREVDIYIDGQIVDASTQAIIKAYFGDSSSVSYKSFRDELAAIDADVYNVYINSPGGMVTDAMAMHDLLIDMQNKGKIVNTIGRGLIASSATLLLLAGKEPTMSANSMFMIHTVSGGAYGTVDEMESYAASMRKFNNMIVDLYVNKTGLSKDKISSMMTKETWLTAKEAEDQKFIMKKISNANFSNTYSIEDWPFENTAVLNTYNSQVNNNFDMKKIFADFTAQIIAAFKGVKPNEDHTALMTDIANAITKPFEALQTGLETEIAALVKLATVDQTVIDAAVTLAIKSLTTQITDLETEITNIKGKPSKGNIEEGIKPIGGFGASK